MRYKFYNIYMNNTFLFSRNVIWKVSKPFLQFTEEFTLQRLVSRLLVCHHLALHGEFRGHLGA